MTAEKNNFQLRTTTHWVSPETSATFVAGSRERPGIWRSGVIGLLLVFFVAGAGSVSGATKKLDSIVAVVDEDVILDSELRGRLEQIKQGVDPSQLPADDELTIQVLERLIVENLELQLAERAGVRISDAELNGAINGIASQNGMTIDQFQNALAADGISYADMREQIRREMRISRVQRGVMNSRIAIPEQELVNFLQSEVGEVVTSDEYQLLHILLALDEDADAEKVQQMQEKADELLAELRTGADFKRLAMSSSAGQNALEGGDLGWRKAVQLPTLFADRVQTMAIDEIVGPIKSSSGFHIIKLINKRGAKAEGKVAQIRSRHILIKPTEIRSEEEAMELANGLLEEIRGGADFAKLAQINSDDPGSALSGGDLGWNQAGAFVPQFEEVQNRLELNQVSDVFRSEHGYHIIEVTGQRIQDFSEEFRRAQAENFLRNRKFEEELDNWLREIREDAFVDIRI